MRSRSPCAASIPSSASRTTASEALISFFIPRSPGVEEVERQRAEDAADDRCDDRDPRVAPVRRALARDRQDRVDDARTEVACGVDRVAGRAAERQPDGEDQEA